MYKVTIHEVDENGNLVRDLQTEEMPFTGFAFMGMLEEDGGDGWSSGTSIMQHLSVDQMAQLLTSDNAFIAAASKALMYRSLDIVRTFDVGRAEGADKSMANALEDAIINTFKDKPEGGLQ